MESKFGGVPVEASNTPTSKFGGVATDSRALNNLIEGPSAYTKDVVALKKLGNDEPGYVYGDILPIKKNIATGEHSFAMPEMLRSPIRGTGELIENAQHKEIDQSPDTVAAMMALGSGFKPAAKAVTKATEIIAPKVANLTVKGIKNVAEGAGTMKRGFNAKSSEDAEKALAAIENDAGTHFQGMKGVGLDSESSSAIAKFIDKSVRENTEIDPDLHSGYLGAITRLQERAKNGMTLKEWHNQRRLLRGIEMKSRVNNPDEARIAREAIDALDEGLETVKQKGGSTEGAQAISSMQTGISKWAQARKFETVADTIQKTQGDPNKIKTAFNNLLNNKKKMRGFTDEEKALIKIASENTTPEALMSLFGKLGFGTHRGVAGNTAPWIPVVASIYNHGLTPASAALTTIGTGAKYGQKLLARGKADDVLTAIQNRPIEPSINTGTLIQNAVGNIP